MLGNRSKIALNKLGDILCPKHEEFPSYSELGAVCFVDGMLEYAPASDAKDLNLLLTILSFFPRFILEYFIQKMGVSFNDKGGIWVLMRQLNFGIKGLIFSSYYCGKRPQGYTGKLPTDVIGFSLNRMEA